MPNASSKQFACDQGVETNPLHPKQEPKTVFSNDPTLKIKITRHQKGMFAPPFRSNGSFAHMYTLTDIPQTRESAFLRSRTCLRPAPQPSPSSLSHQTLPTSYPGFPGRTCRYPQTPHRRTPHSRPPTTDTNTRQLR